MFVSSVFTVYVAPFLIVLAIAAVLAFLLGYLGKIFEVKRDPKIDEVRAHLAGINCGACGYAGCDDFAKALAEGKAKIGDCKPTSAGGKQAIGAILGTAADGEETVAVVRCAGGNLCDDKCDYQGYGDCVSAELLAGGNKACVVGCMGKCSCVKVCGYDAIDVKEEVGCAVVDEQKCTSCGNCIKECPKKLIHRIPVSAKVFCACSNPDKGKAVTEVCRAGCIGCGVCARVCEYGAITMKDNLPEFDYQKCVACMKCLEKCPRKIIRKHGDPKPSNIENN